MIGKLLYKLYHQPKVRVCNLFYTHFTKYKLVKAGKEQMILAAMNISEIYRNKAPHVEAHFLTGKNFWYQSVFCLHSLQQVTTDLQVNAVFYDDGSLDEKITDLIHLNFPNSRIESMEMLEENLNVFLPYQKFPYLRKTRETYFHLKKLTDIHAGKNGWKLVLDSDMLFFKYPAEVSDWLKNPTENLALMDKKQSYGYSIAFLENIAGHNLPRRINVGALGIKSESIDWEKIEHWIKCLSKKKNSYYLEQAITAMLLAETPGKILDPADYIVLPDKPAVLHGKGILHHYVAESKDLYFTQAWKKVL
jgi:hypothetical protein